MRPPLDARAALRLLAVGAPLFAVLLGLGPRRTGDFVLLATFGGALVAVLYGRLAQRSAGAAQRVVHGLQGFVIVSPMFVAGVFEGAGAPTLATSGAVLAAGAAALEALRRRRRPPPAQVVARDT